MRPGQALRLWHDVSLALVRDGEPDLSARQVTVLITIYLDPQPHTVRALAEKLGVTKPVITRALDTMGRQGLVSASATRPTGATCSSSAPWTARFSWSGSATSSSPRPRRCRPDREWIDMSLLDRPL